MLFLHHGILSLAPFSFNFIFDVVFRIGLKIRFGETKCIPTVLPCRAEVQMQMLLFFEEGEQIYWHSLLAGVPEVTATLRPLLPFPREWAPFSDQKKF